MKRTQRRCVAQTLAAWLVMAFLAACVDARGAGVSVSGKVVMPEVCSPSVSPAVVWLESKGESRASGVAESGASEVALVNQRGLQFVPRVQAIALGQTIRFTNEDNETHNVHVVSTGDSFNVTMPSGQPRDFTPTKPGVVRLVCDIHSHMRGYVVVSASPWVSVCSAKGRFRLDDVPAGRYVLNIWHEMGEPLTAEVTVGPGDSTDLGAFTLTSFPPPRLAAGQAAPVRVWADVIDRIGMLLSASLDAAGKTNQYKKARKLAEDAYWAEFEASDMETAVRMHLGIGAAVELEQKFRAVLPALKRVGEGTISASDAIETTRPLMLALVRASDALNKKGVTDAAHLQPDARTTTLSASSAAPVGDPDAQLDALKHGFDGIRALADSGEADEAASGMTAVYFDEFEPLERFIAVHRPSEVRPLELQFNAIRGELGQGLKGQPLEARLAGLFGEAKSALERGRAVPAGSFSPAFAASFVTIVREGVEVILLLTMLFALVSRTGQAWGRKAIAWGVGAAVLASVGTAAALNLLVASTQGRTREVLEGAVMLSAAGVLFYVSYWLISQVESKRWMEFLKRQAARGTGRGHRGFFPLALTAFLAVYREGAETALMYQAMIGSQSGARAGLSGLAAGLALGLVALAAIAFVIRATSVRLPLRPFFQVTGGLLFAMAVVFAGNGVFALQSSGILKSTPLTWLGGGLPILGVYPNVQALSVQCVLLMGAALALALILGDTPANTGARREKQELVRQ